VAASSFLSFFPCDDDDHHHPLSCWLIEGFGLVLSILLLG